MSYLRRLQLALICLALSACATTINLSTLGNQAPGTPEADILSMVGKPESSSLATDGSSRMIYSTQPGGTQCFLLEFDKNRQLVSVEDTLSQAGRDKVEAGMTRDALMARMCQPTEHLTTAHPYEVLSWNMEPFTATKPRMFDVYLQNNQVIRTEVRTLYFQSEH